MEDLINEKILNILEMNSRITINELSKQVNLSAPAVRERINKMEEQGIIKDYTINIDYKKLGYDVEILIEIIIKNNRYKDSRSSYLNRIMWNFVIVYLEKRVLFLRLDWKIWA